MFAWDSSALAKRYTHETGTDTVLALLAAITSTEVATTVWGYAEAFSVLLRCFNRGTISAASFSLATSALEAETLRDPNVALIPVEDSDVIAGIALMQQHNLNSVDAAFLAAVLRFQTAAHMPVPCVLVAADHRLVRAAQAEGLTTLNPEQLPAADVSAFLASL